MRKILTLMIILSLIGCAGTIPKNTASIESSIVIKNDSFKKVTWINTPLFLSRQGFTDRFPVNIMYRALYKEGKRIFIQMYLTKMTIDWGFYHSANGEDGYKFEFVKIDSQVDSTGGMVTTNEIFALLVPYEYLEKMEQKDWRIKVYGKRDEGVFVVPNQLTKAFLNKLKCFETKSCK